MFRRRALSGLLLALASCASVEQSALPNDENSGAGTSDGGGAGGKPGTAGNPGAGMPNGGAGATSGSGGANASSGAAGANNTAGNHGGGAAGTSGSAGSHSGGASGSSGNGGWSGANPGGASNGGGAGSPGSGTVLFSDDFEDGNADGWVPAGGTWAVASDGSKVYAQQADGTGSAVLLSAGGSTTWTNQIVEAKIKVKAFGGQSTSYLAAIYARFSGGNYYALALRSDGKVAIRNGNTTLGSAVAAGIEAGTWYTVRLEVVGSTLKAYVDGALKDTETDTSLTTGGIALSAVNTTVEFDDVKVTLP